MESSTYLVVPCPACRQEWRRHVWEVIGQFDVVEAAACERRLVLTHDRHTTGWRDADA